LNSSGIEAIIFDLDGVLVKAEDWHEEAFVKAMGDYGYDVTPNFKRKGNSTMQRLRELSLVGRAPHNFKPIAGLKQKYIKEIIEEKCIPIDRVIDAVNFAHTYTNGKIAVATNCSRKSAVDMLERSGLLPFFDVVVTSDDIQGNLKPHAMPFLEASYRLGVFSKKCLAVDDSDIGIMSAVNAMCRTLRIRRFEELTADLMEASLKSLEIRI
jgi:beta-phosphoglucomutase-like phosphatase (HAD superfamily)